MSDKKSYRLNYLILIYLFYIAVIPIFAIQPRPEDAANYFNSIKSQMTDIGRDPDACKILFGMQPIIGSSEAEAREKQEEHNALVPLEGGMAILSAHLDFDLSKIPFISPDIPAIMDPTIITDEIQLVTDLSLIHISEPTRPL